MTKSDEGPKGVSMLDKLAGQITETKAAKGSKLAPALTPVAGEVSVSPIPNHPLGSLPEDPDLILQRLAAAKQEVLAVLDAIGKLEVAWGAPEQLLAHDAEVSEALIQKEKERRADDAAKARAGDKKAEARVTAESPLEAVVEAEEARLRKRAAVLTAMAGETPGGDAEPEDFDARLARQTAEAQAATFKQPSPAATAPEVPDASGWACPDHGTEHIITKISPRRGVEFRKCAADGCHEFEKV